MFCENTFPGKEQTDNIHDKNEILSTYFSVNVEVWGGERILILLIVYLLDLCWCKIILNVWLVLKWPCVVDGTLKPNYSLTTQCVGYVPTPLWQLDVKQVKWHLPSKKMLQINMGRDGEIYTQYD